MAESKNFVHGFYIKGLKVACKKVKGGGYTHI